MALPASGTTTTLSINRLMRPPAYPAGTVTVPIDGRLESAFHVTTSVHQPMGPPLYPAGRGPALNQPWQQVHPNPALQERLRALGYPNVACSTTLPPSPGMAPTSSVLLSTQAMFIPNTKPVITSGLTPRVVSDTAPVPAARAARVLSPPRQRKLRAPPMVAKTNAATREHWPWCRCHECRQKKS